MISNDSFQTFLKIISWEDFFKYCNRRVDLDDGGSIMDQYCAASPDHNYFKCNVSNKEMMLKCPIWKDLRNFYGSKVWSKIKRMEDDNGRLNQSQRQTVAERCKRDKRQYGNKKGWFREETF